jgi:hypothetical protein
MVQPLIMLANNQPDSLAVTAASALHQLGLFDQTVPSSQISHTATSGVATFRPLSDGVSEERFPLRCERPQRFHNGAAIGRTGRHRQRGPPGLIKKTLR